MTKKQLLERENLEWFCDPNDPLGIRRFGLPTDEAFKEYLDWSERGIPFRGFNFYDEAKRRRGITIHELWEDSFYKDGVWIGFDGLLREENNKPIPKHIAEYIAKEIFRGQDKEKIMNHYAVIEKEFSTVLK